MKEKRCMHFIERNLNGFTHTLSTVKPPNLVTADGLNWFAKFSSPSPNLPCLPSPNVKSTPLSEETVNTVLLN